MSTDAIFPAATTERSEASSTAWFWWKETRQLAPLILLLTIVAMLILALNSIVAGISGGAFHLQLPHEVTMLVFPGLFATGAGPLLVGQERAQRTIDWLALLPMPAKRLITTKLYVGLVGLIAMWAFVIVIVALFDLGKPGTSPWRIGQQTAYSQNPLSYPVWLIHSLFVLISGFFVAWKIKNQFYSLIALVPLAFAPMIATSIVSEVSNRHMTTGELDWISFGFTLLGIVLMTPLTYRAAIRTLGPSDAPSVLPLLDVSPHSPARETNDALPPRFGTHTAPIIWQSIHSARGMLTILIAMLLVSWLAAMSLALESHHRGIYGWLPPLLLAAPLAVCWLGISVFKHDGGSDRIRFLADRGLSPAKTYCGLHAVPVAILCTALVVYGLWNLTLSHRFASSAFAATLPTIPTMMLFVAVIYGVSQWTSQFARTMILSAILAPILSVLATGWLVFGYVSLGLPMVAMVVCALAPFAATMLLMRRYMDCRDRLASLVVGMVVLGVITLVPIGFAAAHVLSIDAMSSTMRDRLLAEANRLKPATQVAGLMLSTLDSDDVSDGEAELQALLDLDLPRYSIDPEQMIAPLTAKLAASDQVSAQIQQWDYVGWHGGLTWARIIWRQDQNEDAWGRLASWIDASAILLPALRRSTRISDQEMADQLEVLLIATLKNDIPSGRRDDVAVQAAINSLGTPRTRAVARRRAVLTTWRNRIHAPEGRKQYHYLHQLQHQPQGLLPWTDPRLFESLVLAMLEGIEAAENHSTETRWCQKLHQIHQTGGVFETSRYGSEMRSKPAIQTMIVGRINGYGQLWGRDWEYVDTRSLLSSPTNVQAQASSEAAKQSRTESSE